MATDDTSTPSEQSPDVYRPRRPADTVLYQIVAQHLETYLYLARQGDLDFDAVPEYVEREFRKYLACGILAHGFARGRCANCGHDVLIAFSCKGRGVCGSCNGRRMAELAAHLTDHVFPVQPVRQWVLSVPKRLRYFLQQDPATATAVLHIFLRALETELRRVSPGAGPKARFGAVSFLHRFGGAINANFHYHCCVLDGVFALDAAGTVRFYEAIELTQERIDAVQGKVRRRVLKAFVRRGWLEPDEAQEMLQWDHAGGFSIDASVRIEAWDRAALERLLRYCARPPFANDRLEWDDPAQQTVLYHLPKPAPDGRLVLKLQPLELIDKLVALIPPPRRHRHRYHGVLAPNAPWREQITADANEQAHLAERLEQTVAEKAQSDATDDAESKPFNRPRSRYLWAVLLARIFEVFPLTCARCGQEMRIIAFVIEAASVQRILDHIGEPSTPPGISPCRGPPQWEETVEPVFLDEGVQPEPEYPPDQTVSW